MVTPAPSPIARALLELRERGADGLIQLGERTLRLNGGKVVSISALSTDDTIATLLAATGRIPSHASTLGDDLRALAKTGVDIRALNKARRATWTDRLIDALDGLKNVPEIQPAARRSEEHGGEDLLTLLLDALAVIAAEQEAGAIGERADSYMHAAASPLAASALEWAGIDEEDFARPLSRLLARSPGSASRVAALVRAGLLWLGNSGSVAPPSRRSELPPGRTAPPPDLAHQRESHENLGQALDLPAVTMEDDDPLSALEHRVAELEQVGAPGPTRAEAWGELARAWTQHFGAVAETARALRESAAADPTDTTYLLSAADACARLGRLDLSDAYEAAASKVAHGTRRLEVAKARARTAMRGEQRSIARVHLRAAESDIEEIDAEVLLWAASLESEPERTGLLVQAARRLAEDDPERAIGILISTAEDESSRTEAAELAARMGRPLLAIDLMCPVALADVSVSERMTCAEIAERQERFDIAVDLLADVFAADPSITVIHEPLALDAERVDTATSQVMSEAIALWGPDDATAKRVAGERFAKTPDAVDWGNELILRAWAKEPSNEAAESAVRELCASRADPGMLADALERCAPGDVTGRLLRELAQFAEERLGSASRALWAWEQLLELDAENEEAQTERARLHERLRIKRGLVQVAREDHQRAPTLANTKRLAAMLRDHPEERAEAIELYKSALEEDPKDRTVRRSLERLLRLGQSEDELLEVLKHGLDGEHLNSSERVRSARWVVALACKRGNFALAAEQCKAWLEARPRHAEALVRLELIAKRDPEQRALVDKVLVDNAMKTGRWSWNARRADERRVLNGEAPCCPQETSAKLEADLLGDPLNASTVKRAIEYFGPAISLRQGLEPAATPEALVLLSAARCDLRPKNTQFALAYLEAATTDQEREAAIEHACNTYSPRLAAPSLRCALQIENPTRCVELCAKAIDRLGASELSFQVIGEERPEIAADPAIVERLAAWTPKTDDKVSALASLARGYRERFEDSSRVSFEEARAWLRVIGLAPHHDEALLRLSERYASTGQDAKLLATLGLRLESAPTPDQRLRVLRTMVHVASVRAQDVNGALEFAGQLFDEHEDLSDGVQDVLETFSRDGNEELATRWAREESASERNLSIATEMVDWLRRRGDAPAALALATSALLQGGSNAGPLWIAFEKIAADERAITTANQTFAALDEAALGRHARRGTRFRWAKWLERQGEGAEALRRYKLSFDIVPARGPAFDSIARLSATLGEHAPHAEALVTLADSERRVDERLELRRAAAKLYSEELSSPLRAVELNTQSLSESKRLALIPSLRATAAKVRHADRARLVELRKAWLEALEARVESTWDADEQCRSLLVLAQVLGDQGEPAAVLSTLRERVLPLVPEIENLPSDLPERVQSIAPASAPEPLREIAEKILDAMSDLPQGEKSQEAAPVEVIGHDFRHGGTSSAPPGGVPTKEMGGLLPASRPPQTGGSALGPGPDATPSRHVETMPPAPLVPPEALTTSFPSKESGGFASQDLPVPRRRKKTTRSIGVKRSENSDVLSKAESGSSETQPTTNETVSSAPPPPRAPSDAPVFAKPKGETQGNRITESAAENTIPAGSRSVSGWFSAPPAALTSPAPALTNLVSGGARNTKHSSDSVSRGAPYGPTVRALRANPADGGLAERLAQMSERENHAELSAVARSLARLAEGTNQCPETAPPQLREASRVMAEHLGLSTALGLLWRHGGRLLQRRPREYGLLGTSRLSRLSGSEIGRDYRDFCEAFDLEPPTYTGASESGIRFAATRPVAVMLPPDLEQDPPPLRRFRLHRALALACDEHALVASRTRSQARVVLDAMWAAFGPTQAVNEVTEEAALIASDFWREIPQLEQGLIRALLSERSTAPSESELYAIANGRAAKAAFTLTPSLEVAFAALRIDAAELKALPAGAPFEEALRASPSMAATVAFALGSRFLNAERQT